MWWESLGAKTAVVNFFYEYKIKVLDSTFNKVSEDRSMFNKT